MKQNYPPEETRADFSLQSPFYWTVNVVIWMKEVRKMILSDGKNNFQNNEFSFWEWSAPVLQTHEEVMAKIKELKLQGRVIVLVEQV